MASYQQAFDRLMQFEGGYVFDPHDAGGETFCGISRKAWPDWIGWGRIDSYKREGKEVVADGILKFWVFDFYSANFWIPLKCDLILSQSVANYLFDFAVNSGATDAVKALQRIVGVRPDGVIGNVTIAAVNAKDLDLIKFREFRLLHYCACIAGDRDNMRFAMGWIRRALA